MPIKVIRKSTAMALLPVFIGGCPSCGAVVTGERRDYSYFLRETGEVNVFINEVYFNFKHRIPLLDPPPASYPPRSKCYCKTYSQISCSNLQLININYEPALLLAC